MPFTAAWLNHGSSTVRFCRGASRTCMSSPSRSRRSAARLSSVAGSTARFSSGWGPGAGPRRRPVSRLAIFILAAPGLFGWPFVGSGWQPVDPLTVSLDRLARPEYFRGMAALGFRLVTHSAGIVDAAAAAGGEGAFVGTGRPNWTAPPPADKSIDVAP